ncbi:MAG TPA: tetratricopeptide repeat protein [Chloroflexia bacterium]|nr:tetratricopeptide repeat protein [Chloroflexia bacterium]
MYCPVCKAAIKAGDEFCDNCGAVLAGATAAAANSRMRSQASKVGAFSPGAPIITPPPAAANNFHPAIPAKICPNCSTPNSAQEDFCQVCGADLNAPPPVVAPKPVPAATPALQAKSANGNGSKAPQVEPEEVVSCPRCQNMILPTDKFCRKCGFSATNLFASSQPLVKAAQEEKAQVLKIAIGSTLGDKGRYHITRQIGSGGMGSVFLAEDNVLKRKVVIKALLQSDDPELVQASIKEREFLAAVKHPNVVQIYDFLQIDTDGYIVMEFVNGKTLFTIMEEQAAPFETAQAIRYILDILPAFSYMHRLGLIYCDFKPQNIMLEQHKDGTTGVKLIDLGTVIRYEKNPSAVYGTQGFYAPEAVKNPSPETDLYTVARSLAYMVSLMDLDHPQFGMPPAEHYKIFRDNPALYRLLVKATHPVQAKRFSTVEAMTDQLEGVLRVIAGGQPGVPVSSKLFSVNGFTTGKLGTREIANLDEKDKAYDLLKQGDAAVKAGQVTQALALFNQAAGVNPNSPDAHLRLADLYMERDQFSQALSEITRVQRIDPNNWKIAWYTGRLLEVQGNLPAALDQYRELAEDLPGELPPLLSLARVYSKLGKYQEAVETYRLVMRAHPDNPEALFGAASCLASEQKYKEAVAVLNQVSESSAKFVEAQQIICDLYLYHKPQIDADDLLIVSNALRNLQQQGVETQQFLLARADFYRLAWELAGSNKLPPQFPLPDLNPDATAKGMPRKRQLGKLAEESYDHYIKRLPPGEPSREQVVREKFRVAPWRLF